MDKIDEIWDYVLNTSQCRSRYLLRYFGENTSHNCGHCDVCLGHYPLDDTSATMDSVQQQILELIAEKNTLIAEDFKNLRAPEELKKAALRELLDENIIGAQGDKIVKL
jgi:ATP-dependent DNA helicase RecQ